MQASTGGIKGCRRFSLPLFPGADAIMAEAPGKPFPENLVNTRHSLDTYATHAVNLKKIQCAGGSVVLAWRATGVSKGGIMDKRGLQIVIDTKSGKSGQVPFLLLANVLKGIQESYIMSLFMSRERTSKK